MITRSDALKILEDLSNSPNMVKHALACGFAMRELCNKLLYHPSKSSQPSNPSIWEIVGMLHDADYEATDKSLDRHTDLTTKKLKEINADEQIIDAIRGHCDKTERNTLMAKSIYAVD